MKKPEDYNTAQYFIWNCCDPFRLETAALLANYLPVAAIHPLYQRQQHCIEIVHNSSCDPSGRLNSYEALSKRQKHIASRDRHRE
jgi:hypothetical protein